MKKIMIVTDIHGSAYWAEQAVAVFKESGADLLVLLGDLYNHGPRNPIPEKYNPMEAADALNSVADRILAVKGNCDSEVDEFVCNFPIFSEAMLFEFGRRLYFTHGHVHNEDNLPPLSKNDALFHGHFHVNGISEENGITVAAVGSSSLPKDGVHSYATVDCGGIKITSFDGKIVAQKAFN